MGEREGAPPPALAALGYDSKWWRYGFVDGRFLQAQLARLRAGDDPHGEHYRYAAFLRILEARAALDDVTLARFVELATLDRDQLLAQAALIRLAGWPGLTEGQRAWLRGHPALAAPVVRRAFDRPPRGGARGR